MQQRYTVKIFHRNFDPEVIFVRLKNVMGRYYNAPGPHWNDMLHVTRFYLIGLCLFLSLSESAPALATQRLALVIGNANYAEGRLANPLRDAKDVAASLRSMNFDVIELQDAKRKQMYKTIRQFGKKLSNGGVGLFYYAGHGVQVEGNNYLIPIDAEIVDQAEVPSEAIDVNLILRKMDGAANGLNIMILDACRNNPYAAGFRSTARGLARIEGPTGSIIAFSTAPGAVAYDGDPGQNSLFTRHFLNHMQTPDLPIELMFKRVRIAVEKETKGKQVPWESSSLKGDFSFVTHALNTKPSQYEPDLEAIAAAERKRLAEKRKQASQQSYIDQLAFAQRVIAAPYVVPKWFTSSRSTRSQLKSAYTHLMDAKKMKPGDQQVTSLLEDLDKKYADIVNKLLAKGKRKEAKEFLDDSASLNFNTQHVARASEKYKRTKKKTENKEKTKFNNFGGF